MAVIQEGATVGLLQPCWRRKNEEGTEGKFSISKTEDEMSLAPDASLVTGALTTSLVARR